MRDIRFGAFTLAPGRCELLFQGARVNLGSRAFDLLMALVSKRGRLVSKGELIAEVWPGRVVDENNLAAQISALRKVLAADPRLIQCLQTVPGRGYRFVADIETGTETGPDTGTSMPADFSPAAEALSLVVLPFASLSSDAEQAWFAQGVSHTVAIDLSRISGLLVISSATAATFEAKRPDARQVCRQLGVRYVLIGSVQRIGPKVRIHVQLVDGQRGSQIWSELFDGDDSDLFALQEQITGRIANSIGREIFVADAREGESRHVDAKAWDLVARGIAADNRPQSLASLREQERLFARAVELDPGHGDAHARLARAILLQATQVHAASPLDSGLLARGIGAARTALVLEPANARAHLAMGLVHVLRRDFERSASANETAISLDRNFALAHNNLGNSLVHLGDGTEALSAVETALRLDPRGPQSGAFWTTAGFARLLLGEIDAAVGCFSRARAENPKLPRAQVGAAISLALRGDIPAARSAASELSNLVADYRLTRTMDASLPTSCPAYREFYEEILRPGAQLAGLPV